MIKKILSVLLLASSINGFALDSARVDEIANDKSSGQAFMGSVLLMRDETVIFEQSYGFANLEWKIPNSAATKFRIGSLTKQFTAAAILLLEERGKLKVEDRISKYLPDTPRTWSEITLFHLLTHTSGIQNFTRLPGYATTWKLTPEGLSDTIAELRTLPLEFTPGEKRNYSNSGYLLLGRIIERVSGQAYGTFLQENIFQPLGMHDSGYDSSAAVIPNRASGYVAEAGGFSNADYVDMHVPYAAGSLYSTPRDLHRWTQGLFGGKLLSSASLKKMTTPFKDSYAFGLNVNNGPGRHVVSHGGSIDGFKAALSYYPETKVTEIVLSNTDSHNTAELARKLTALYFGEPVTLTTEREEIELPVSTLQLYVGVYQEPHEIKNTIRLVKGRLTSQLSSDNPAYQGARPAVDLWPESKTRFFVKTVDSQMEFIIGDDGKVTRLLRTLSGKTREAPRIGDAVETGTVAPVAPKH